MDTERARKARRKLRRVVQTDYFNTLVTPEAFNLMLLNPPYDFDPDYKRLEQRFLVRATQLLVTGGVLIYMAPRYVLNTSAKFLARNYSDFRVWQEDGNPDAERFNQVMLVAVRNTSPANQTENRQSLERSRRASWISSGKIPGTALCRRRTRWTGSPRCAWTTPTSWGRSPAPATRLGPNGGT